MTMAVSLDTTALRQAASGTRSHFEKQLSKRTQALDAPAKFRMDQSCAQLEPGCNAGMTFGALAVWKMKRSLPILFDRAVKTITLPMNDYEPDGAYPEGYSYWGTEQASM